LTGKIAKMRAHGMDSRGASECIPDCPRLVLASQRDHLNVGTSDAEAVRNTHCFRNPPHGGGKIGGMEMDEPGLQAPEKRQYDLIAERLEKPRWLHGKDEMPQCQ
jgi:hypothetical protein